MFILPHFKLFPLTPQSYYSSPSKCTHTKNRETYVSLPTTKGLLSVRTDSINVGRKSIQSDGHNRSEYHDTSVPDTLRSKPIKIDVSHKGLSHEGTRSVESFSKSPPTLLSSYTTTIEPLLSSQTSDSLIPYLSPNLLKLMD